MINDNVHKIIGSLQQTKQLLGDSLVQLFGQHLKGIELLQSVSF